MLEYLLIWKVRTIAWRIECHLVQLEYQFPNYDMEKQIRHLRQNTKKLNALNG